MRRIMMHCYHQPVFANGKPLNYDEPALVERLQTEEIEMTLSLGMGHAQATFWASDLTAEYVKINAHYRT